LSIGRLDMDIFLDYVWAFVIGGAFCVIAQILLDKTELTPARILVGYVVVGVVLGALGLYKPILDFAGAGASTPLTGFGYVIAKGVKTAVEEKGFLGALGGGLSASAAVVSAVLGLAFIAALVSKSKPK
jgi:stage V sporulation protein AE